MATVSAGIFLGTPIDPSHEAVPVPPKPLPSNTQIQSLIERVQKGDPGSKEALLDHACERLLRLTRKMPGNYPSLRRREQTDDVFQNSMLTLHRSLEKMDIPSSPAFFQSGSSPHRARVG